MHKAPPLSYLQSQENMANVPTSNSYFCVKSRHFSQAEKITELNCIHVIYERNASCFHPHEADDSSSLKWFNWQSSFPDRRKEKKCIWFGGPSTWLGYFLCDFLWISPHGMNSNPASLLHPTHFCFAVLCLPKAWCAHKGLPVWSKIKVSRHPGGLCTCERYFGYSFNLVACASVNNLSVSWIYCIPRTLSTLWIQ